MRDDIGDAHGRHAVLFTRVRWNCCREGARRIESSTLASADAGLLPRSPAQAHGKRTGLYR